MKKKIVSMNSLIIILAMLILAGVSVKLLLFPLMESKNAYYSQFSSTIATHVNDWFRTLKLK